jgi:hypothetical protein
VAESIFIEKPLPKDWQTFRLRPALRDRLHELLDRQDRESRLSSRERREAQALVQLVDLLATLRVRTKVAKRQQRQ